MREPSAEDVQLVVHQARKRGVRAAEALYQSETGVDLFDSPGQEAVRNPVASEALRVRVWTDDGEGLASGRFRSWDAVVDAAIAAVSPVPAYAGPVQRLQVIPTGLATEDRRLGHLTDEDRWGVLREAQSACRSLDQRFAPQAFGYEERLVRRVFANHAGAKLAERGTAFRAWGSALVTPQSTPIPLQAQVSGRSFASVASLPFGVELARRAAALLGSPVLLARGPVRVLLGSPQMAALLDRLAQLCLPDLLDGTFLPRVALDPRMHLVDDPTLPGGLRSRAFDDRGVPPIPLTLLREGRAHATLLDARRAAQREVRPSGHEVGDHLESSNLIFRHGTRSVHVILGELGGTTFAPDDLAGFAGLDARTGQFAATVHGMVYEGARPVGPALGVRLSGYLGDILARMVEVSGETDRIGHIDAPAVVLDGFSAG